MRRLFWFVIACTILYVILDTVAQLLPPYYSPISQAESYLAVGPYGYIMTVNFLIRGLLSFVLLYAFARTVGLRSGKGRGYLVGMVLLAVWAAGAVLLAVFPVDVPPAGPTLHGIVHLAVASLAFIGGAFGETALSLGLAKDEAFSGAARVAIPISVLALAFLFLFFGLPEVLPQLAARFYGLTERAFIGFVLLWILAISVFMANYGGPEERARP